MSPSSTMNTGVDRVDIQARLDTCLALRGQQKPTELAAALNELRALDLNAEQALQVELIALHPNLIDGAFDARSLMQRAFNLLELAQAIGSHIAQAFAWELLYNLQFDLRLHNAAMHSAANAAAFFEQCHCTSDALTMRVKLCGALSITEMHAEAIEQSQALLDQAETLRANDLHFLYNIQASSHYFLAQTATTEHAAAHWRQCLTWHEHALALGEKMGSVQMRAISHLNLGVVHASLGQKPQSLAHLAAAEKLMDSAAKFSTQTLEAGRLWRQLSVLMLMCQGDAAEQAQAWPGLRQMIASLHGTPGIAAMVLEAALRALMRLGRQAGQYEMALDAAADLLNLQVQRRQELAQSLGETVADVVERPRLERRNEQLSQHGVALEKSLADRNLELTKALAELQAEAATRRAAEARLQEAHDHLEDQVRIRSAELKDATQALMRQEKQLAMSRMVAGMAHEMNTPLGNARLAASTIHARGVELEASMHEGRLSRNQLQNLLSALADGSSLMDQALQRVDDLVVRFKSLDTGPTHERQQDFDLSALIQGLASAWTPSLQARQISLQLEVPARLQLNGFPEACRSVLQHLFNNSLVHGQPPTTGEPARFALTVTATPKGITLLWQDNGPGISEAHLQRVFDPFFTTQLGQSGLGLGLSTVHNLVVDQMKGQVLLSSQPGLGTTVTLHLPSLATT